MDDKLAEAYEEIEDVDPEEIRQLDPVGVCQHPDCNGVIRAHKHRKDDIEGIYVTITCPECGRDPGVKEKLNGDE